MTVLYHVLRSSLSNRLGFFNDASCMAALEAEHLLQHFLDHRLKVIDYLGCAMDLRDAQLGAIFNQEGERLGLQHNDILVCHCWMMNRFLQYAAYAQL